MTSRTDLNKTLADWLQYIEALHPKSIAMGLDRVNQVKQRLKLNPSFPIVTVAGTNGKGSTCAMLSRIYHETGYRVACYSSPHLLNYNERVTVACQPISDNDLCVAFAAVEKARQDTALTYFEFGTLAAMWHFINSNVDVAILEVGLGGRLDAVNAFDPECSIVTSIDLDHIEFLGNSRESIAFEKAGVFRSAQPAICGDIDPPQGLIDHANSIGAHLKLSGKDFAWEHKTSSNVWSFKVDNFSIEALPIPALAGDFQFGNAACALTAISLMQTRLPVKQSHIVEGLKKVCLSGRFQLLSQKPAIIVDVAHNPHAAIALVNNLRAHPCKGRTFAVFSMLADKDILGVIQAVGPEIHDWYIAKIDHVRSATVEHLTQIIEKDSPETPVKIFKDIVSAYHQACFDATENDRIIVFGSFFTVADVLRLKNDSQ